MINEEIRLVDNMSEQLKKITNNINDTSDAWDDLSGNMQGGLDPDLDSTASQFDDIGESIDSSTAGLGKMAGALGGVLTAVGLVSKAFDVMQDSIDAANTQLNSEIQLSAVLKNTVGEGWETSFNQLKQHASDLQSMGIYGDEALIGAAGEFSTYMTDTNAIQIMMDTLVNYAAGMTGGGAVDKNQMVDFATGLGKIMTGSYEAMTKKGFEFTEQQKMIIENGNDMQKALVIQDVINESWAGLYEQISDTPEGELISLQNKFGDLEEEIGQKLYPKLIEIYEWVDEHWDGIEDGMDALGDFFSDTLSILTSIADAIDPIMAFFDYLRDWDADSLADKLADSWIGDLWQFFSGESYDYFHPKASSGGSLVTSFGYMAGKSKAAPSVNPLHEEYLNDEAVSAIEKMASTEDKTSEEVKQINNSIKTAVADLKYIRDTAETEIINRYGTSQMTLNFGGITQNVNSNRDLDGIVEYIADKTREALSYSMEGVHA